MISFTVCTHALAFAPLNHETALLTWQNNSDVLYTVFSLINVSWSFFLIEAKVVDHVMDDHAASTSQHHHSPNKKNVEISITVPGAKKNTSLNSCTEICQNEYFHLKTMLKKQWYQTPESSRYYTYYYKYFKMLQSTMYNIMLNKKQSSAKHVVTMVNHTLYCSFDIMDA